MAYRYEYPHPAVTTDIVVFTIRQDEFEVLLIERASPPFQGAWALPGGFVNLEESLEEGARRELAEETGVSGVSLEQLYTFGEPDRDPRERVITVAYYGVVPADRLETRAASDAAALAWFDVQELPELAFDHAHIVRMARERLAARLDGSTIAFQFMPEMFTLSDLQRVYELILGQALDKRNFRKKLVAAGLVEDTGEERRDGAHRPAKLYRLADRRGVGAIR